MVIRIQLGHTRMMKLVILVSLLLFLLSNISFITCCYDDERAALLNFKSHLTDPSNQLSSWQGHNCCDWHGIHCSDSLHVTDINLPNPNPESFIINMNAGLVSTSNSTTAITGTISSSLFSLTHIRYLDLSFNNFMFSEIPTGFSNLTTLTYLNLSNAMFSGSITTQFSNLTSLRWLDISCSYTVTDFSSISYDLSSSLKIDSGGGYKYIYGGNLFLSSLTCIQGLHNLRELRLSGVDLSKVSRSAQWANPISTLSNIRSLHLSNCKIFGKVPAKELLNLTYLSSLVMDFNSLTSPIPNELENLTSLSILVLTSSNLQGPIPYLPQLRRLFVGNNSDIKIDLHSMFASPWSKLEMLDISSTQVNGSLPTLLANTTSLRRFGASNCLLQGSLPASMMNLSNLEILDLNLNSITGHLSPSMSNMKSLKMLFMAQNYLEGTIPSSICNMSSLQSLALPSNSLTGNLPGCIGQLPNLQSLVININKMNGTLTSLKSLFKNSNPTTISLGYSGLTVKVDQHTLPPNFQTQNLDLSSCHLGGTIPNFISNLTQLAYLSLSNNNLSGTIPSWLFKLPNLGHLDLSLNNLQGVLPPNIKFNSFFGPTTLSLGNNQLQGPIPPLLENIENIHLSWNNFTGYVPLQLGAGKIRYLSLSGNKLYGHVPFSFCQASSVMMLLDISSNSLSGTIPTGLGNCTSLIYLNLGGNNLSGQIPKELQGAKSLSYLELTDNHFDGPFPSFIQKLQAMMVLKMGNNRFQGKIPKFIGNLQNLQILVLESNSFNDSIPWEINKLERLQFVDFSNNKLSGPIPEKLNGLKMLRTRPRDGNLLGYVVSAMYIGVQLDMVSKGLPQEYMVVRTYHSGIDLSCNSLTGNIPFEIGLLEGLYMLNLSHNALDGEIPKAIGDMSGLESLDLSFNQLSGVIPTAITLLDSLSSLHLSYNNLSGKIPTGEHFDTLSVDGSAYVGNELLCGTPIGIKCNNNDSSGLPESDDVDVEDARQQMLFYAIVCIGYGLGFAGSFGVLLLMKENWRKNYWIAIDWIALKIINSCSKNRIKISLKYYE